MLPVATATNKARKFSRQKLTHAYHAFASYVRHEGHLYEVFLVLAIRTGVKGIPANSPGFPGSLQVFHQISRSPS